MSRCARLRARKNRLRSSSSGVPADRALLLGVGNGGGDRDRHRLGDLIL
jgi:hypothetical protein